MGGEDNMIFIMIVFVYIHTATTPITIHSIEFHSKDKCMKAGEELKNSFQQQDAYGRTIEEVIYKCVAK